MKLEKRIEKVNKVRKEGFIPGVIYGKKIESTPIQSTLPELTKALQTYGQSKTFKVKLDGKTHQVYIKDLECETLKPNNIVHFGLLKISASDTITASMPIVLVGKGEVEKEGLVVQHLLHELEVEKPVGAETDHFEVDVHAMKLGDALHVKDISLPEGFKAHHDGEDLVVNVTYPKVQAVEEPAEETTEAVEEVEKPQETEE
jgi:large subunit ribosomal protein L25